MHFTQKQIIKYIYILDVSKLFPPGWESWRCVYIKCFFRILRNCVYFDYSREISRANVMVGVKQNYTRRYDTCHRCIWHIYFVREYTFASIRGICKLFHEFMHFSGATCWRLIMALGDARRSDRYWIISHGCPVIRWTGPVRSDRILCCC